MPRRSYLKGLAKREEILKTALEVIAERGFSGATLRELADASNLSITGLVHHFGTKEELLTEVLRRRDAEGAAFYDSTRLPESTDAMIERLNRVVKRNAAIPGLMVLYSNLSADATDPGHPAHDYFRDHYEQSRRVGREAISHLQEIGELPAEIDPADLAQVIIAAMDGLQLLWQFDKSLNMEHGLRSLETLLKLATDQTREE